MDSYYQAQAAHNLVQERVRTELLERLGHQFSVHTDYPVVTSLLKAKADLAITYGEHVVALFEIKARQITGEDLKKAVYRYGSILYASQVNFFVVSDGEDYFVLNRLLSDSFQIRSINVFVSSLRNYIESRYHYRELPPPPRQMLQTILGIIPNDLPTRDMVAHFLQDLLWNNELALVEDNSDPGRIVIKSIKDEDRLFDALLGNEVFEKVCRFTSLSNAFHLLEGPTQNMCSIVCMNDRGEWNYADDKVGFPLSPDIVDQNNRCFILSCVDISLRNNLTMWRLYGDESKGSNIVYKVKEGNLSPYYLKRISYQREDGSHPELEFVKALFNLTFPGGYRFKLRRWDIWKHFFKSKHFSVEKEIRLLRVVSKNSNKKSKWFENSENRIVSKMLLFDLNKPMGFPLVLDEILLGPNVPEPEYLENQYRYMASKKLKFSITVNTSDIDFYRK